MPGDRFSPQAAERGAWTCAGLASVGATLSIGLSLARQIPAETPTGLMVWFGVLVLLLGAAAVRLNPESSAWSTARRIAVGGGVLAGSFLTACAWSTNGWWLLALTVSWIAIGVPLVALWSLQAGAVTAERVTAGVSSAGPGRDLPEPSHSVQSDAAANHEVDSTSTWDGLTSQRLTRRQVDGCETLSVEWRLNFIPGQQQQSLHLPISPPLAAAPEVECEPLAGDDVELTIGAVHPYGVRIEARRGGDVAQSAECVIALELSAPAAA